MVIKTSGKTAYIHLKMIECMIAQCPFICQTLDRDVYKVSDNLALIDKYWSPTAPIIAFLDADIPPFKPKPFLDDPFIQLIAASSPQGASQPFMNQLAHEGHFILFATALWSPSKLFVTGFVFLTQVSGLH